MENLKFHFFENDNLIKKVSFTGSKKVIVSIGTLGTEILFSGKEISRMHSQLIYDGNDVFIQDCGSSNGTYINNKRLSLNQTVALKNGDSVLFSMSGNAKLIVGENIQVSDPLKKEFVSETSLLKYFEGKSVLTIGRSPDCDVVLSHSSISRLHAQIKKTSAGKYIITDKGSLNGIFVNGKKVQDAVVSESDKIFIGRFLLSLKGATRNLGSESAIRAENISKTYSKGIVALHNTAFDIPSGGLIAIMGPSGCGKSTLLKALNGDTPPTSGSVYILGLELNSNYDYLKTQIGYVPQDDIVHRELTVEQSLYYSAKIRLEGISDDMVFEKIEQLLKSLNIVEIRNNRISAISGGQRKRVSIAVELLSDPSILFLDEPTSPLDPQTIEEFMQILRGLTEHGTTVIMVTHKPDDLNHMDSVIFMAEGGHLVYYGAVDGYKIFFNVTTPVEVYANISGPKAEKWIKKSKESVSNKLSSGNSKKREKSNVNIFMQFFWLTKRYLKIKTNDQFNSMIMVLQAPIIAIFVCCIFSNIRITVPFLMAISAIWFGVNNAAQEIVGEGPIYKRERMFNVLILPYILSKITILSLFAFIQSLLFNLIIGVYFGPYFNDGLHWNDPIAGTLWMFFLTVCSSVLGLLISSYFKSSETVNSVVPIFVLPQIMLAGIVAKIGSPFAEYSSYLTFSRWGTEGFALIQDQVFDVVPVVVPPLDPAGDYVIKNIDMSISAYKILENNFHSSYASTFGKHAGTIHLDFVVVISITFVCLIAIWCLLKKKDSI